MNLTIIALSLMASPQVPTVPTGQVVPTKVNQMICTVAVEVRGKILRFLVDTGSTTTLINPAKVPPGNAPLTGQVVGLEPQFSIRPFALPAFQKMGANPDFEGIIGADVLAKWVFGIDYVQGKLFFWPTGLSPEESQAWMTQGAKVSVRTLKLDEDGQGRFEISRGREGRPYLFDTGANLISVTEPDLDGVVRSDIDSGNVLTPFGAVQLRRQFVRSLSVGGLRPAWLVVTLGEKSEANPVVGASAFRSPRILIDSPNRRLMVVQPSALREAEDALERSFGSPARITDDKVWLDARANLKNGGTKVIRIRVLKVAGFDIDQLAKDLIRGKDSALPILAKLYALLREGCEVQLEIEGKPVTSRMKIAS